MGQAVDANDSMRISALRYVVLPMLAVLFVSVGEAETTVVRTFVSGTSNHVTDLHIEYNRQVRPVQVSGREPIPKQRNPGQGNRVDVDWPVGTNLPQGRPLVVVLVTTVEPAGEVEFQYRWPRRAADIRDEVRVSSDLDSWKIAPPVELGASTIPQVEIRGRDSSGDDEIVRFRLIGGQPSVARFVRVAVIFNGGPIPVGGF